jgi:hypothetical protein
MNSSKASTDISVLREIALEELMATTDAQLHQEAVEDGEDLDMIATQMRLTMRETAAGTLRQQLAQAKKHMKPTLTASPPTLNRPPLEELKKIVQDIFRTDRSLGLAFRDGKTQTDADWLSLYDDLVVMGAIKPEDDGN